MEEAEDFEIAKGDLEGLMASSRALWGDSGGFSGRLGRPKGHLEAPTWGQVGPCWAPGETKIPKGA